METAQTLLRPLFMFLIDYRQLYLKRKRARHKSLTSFSGRERLKPTKYVNNYISPYHDYYRLQVKDKPVMF